MPNFSDYPSITGGSVSTVTLNNGDAYVIVTNETTDISIEANFIYFTVDGRTPTVRGNDTYVCYPGSTTKVKLAGKVVKLIATNSMRCSVESNSA